MKRSAPSVTGLTIQLKFDVQTFIIIVLGCLSLWLAYRLVSLRRGIEDLTQALNDESVFEQEALPETTQQDRLSRLSAAVLRAETEGEVMRVSEKGRRKILDYLFNQIEDALFLVDENYEVRFSNEAARQLFPAAQDQIGRPLIEICRDHHIDETVRLAVSANGKMQDQVNLVNSSETLFIEAGPIDPDYQIGSGAWLMIRDITERVETEQIRKDFVTNASHELRTPLAIINGYLEILDDDEEDDPTISVMKKHTDRLTRIVEDMLTISKLESDQADTSLLRMEVFDISECINGTIERLQLLIDRFDTIVVIELPEKELRGFYGDPFYWDQVFFNLIENALKQNARSGLKITVRVMRLRENDRFEIDVIDNGVGIPAADLEGVFKRFYKVDKQHSSGVKGTGLGLSIVKRAVEAHHGSISVTSQPGRKTCFHLSLPAPPLSALNPV